MSKPIALFALDLNSLSSRGGQSEADDEGDDYKSIWPEHERICLESSTWERIPPDLLFGCILVRLSFPCLLKFRCVSRSWNSRLSSSAFWRSWFRFERNHNCSKASQAASEASFKSWHASTSMSTAFAGLGISNLTAEGVGCHAVPANTGLPNLLLVSAAPSTPLHPAALHWMKKKSVNFARPPVAAARQPWLVLRDSFIPMQEPYTILLADKGLLLIMQYDEICKPRQLIVYNPLIKKWKFLPCPPAALVIRAIQFFVDTKSGDYVVFLDDLSYFSDVGTWQVTPQTLPTDENSSLPLLFDGSMFWLLQKEFMAVSDAKLCVYHADHKFVRCVHTQFPCKVAFPQCGLVWRGLQGLKTLAFTADWFGIWKLDDGLWKKLKQLPILIQGDLLKNNFYASKAGNVLVLSCQGLVGNNLYVFNLEQDEGAWISPHCMFVSVFGHSFYKPSYFDVGDCRAVCKASAIQCVQ